MPTRRDDRRERTPARKARAPFLVVLLDCDRPAAPSSRHWLVGIDEVVMGRAGDGEGDRSWERAGTRLTLRFPDPWMSATHAMLLRAMGGWVLKDAGSTNGTLRNGERVREAPLVDGDLLELGRTMFLLRDAGLEVEGALDADASELALADPAFKTFVPELDRTFRTIARLAPSTVPLVVLGESGTGKELVARAVHGLSGRKGELVAVNCGAIPATLVESTLFGHRKGAFSGATEDRAGVVREAHLGTLFLDEIGDLALSSQAALLRVLQEREVVPVGATRPMPVDIRVVAATHRDLEAEVRDGRFRGDLLARLGGFIAHLPPLRARREDLGILVAAILRDAAPDHGVGVQIAPRVARALFRYEWPFNVRELQKCLVTALALAGTQAIDADHLPRALAPSEHADVPESSPTPTSPSRDVLDEDDAILRETLVRLLREHEGNISAVSRAMGKARMQVHRWMRRFGLDMSDFRSP